MSKPLVVITETLDQVCADWLTQHANVIWCSHKETKRLRGILATAQGAVVRTYTMVNGAFLDQAQQLKVVGRAGVGLDNIDIPACKARGVQVVSTPDANTQAVVEYVFALILDALRPRGDFAAGVTEKTFHQMRKDLVGPQLDELTLGILGFGRIGKRIGQVAHAIGMKLLVNDLLSEKELRTAVNYPFAYVDKPALFRGSDVLTIHVDGRSENRGMINAEVTRQLKPSCLFINAARGMLINNPALASWAKSNASHSGKVILDVHEPEPPPANYPFYGLANVRLLPHLASRTHRGTENMSWVVRDVAAVLEGKKPQHPAW